MAGEALTLNFDGAGVADNPNGAFEEIVRADFDYGYTDRSAQAEIVPFGAFTTAEEETLGNPRTAMVSGTGYTGNNAEESN